MPSAATKVTVCRCCSAWASVGHHVHSDEPPGSAASDAPSIAGSVDKLMSSPSGSSTTTCTSTHGSTERSTTMPSPSGAMNSGGLPGSSVATSVSDPSSRFPDSSPMSSPASRSSIDRSLAHPTKISELNARNVQEGRSEANMCRSSAPTCPRGSREPGCVRRGRARAVARRDDDDPGQRAPRPPPSTAAARRAPVGSRGWVGAAGAGPR